MMKYLCLLFLTFSITFGQNPIKFVTYGFSGNPADGDDNKKQAINFSIPADYNGLVTIRIFDADASANYDAKFGVYDSRFRFSLYKGEMKEEDFNLYDFSNDLLKSLVISDETEFDNSWITFYSYSKASNEEEYYTLFVEGLDGNDANVFKVFISSSDNENINIPNSIVYSYQPSMRLESTKNQITLRFLPAQDANQISIHTFDFDGTKISLSTILRDDIKLIENNKAGWSKINFQLNNFEQGKLCGLNYGPVRIDYNDVNFKLLNNDGSPIRILMSWEDKIKNSLPVVNLKTNYSDCNNVELDFSSSKDSDGNKISLKTFLNDSPIAEQEKFSINFPESGIYQIKVIAQDNSEAVTNSVIRFFNIKINTLPIAKAGTDRVVALNEKVFFNAGNSTDNDGKITSYMWNFGNGKYSNEKSANTVYTESGTYLVTLKVTDDFVEPCNYSIDSIVVVVNSKPVIVTNREIIAAVGEDILFDASQSYDIDGQIISYEWDFGKSVEMKGEKVVRHFSTPGKYSVILKVKDNSSASNSIASEKIDVIINSQPVADAGANKFVGADEIFFLDASKSFDKDGKIISYHWDLGDGFESDDFRVSHSFHEPGAYTIKLKVTDNSETSNNTSETTVTIFVNHPPVAKIQTDNYLSNVEANFDASQSYDPDGEILNYTWDFGDGSIGSGKFVNHKYSSPGTYKVTLKVVDNSMKANNTSYSTEKIVINRAPIADAGKDYVIAPNQTISFNSNLSIDPDGEISETKWFINDEFISNSNSFDYMFTYPGTYKITLQVKDNFPKPLTDSDNAIVKVNQSPVAVISGNKIISPGQKLKLNAFSSYDNDGKIISYKWQSESGEILWGKEVELYFNEPNVYRVILQVTDDANVANSIGFDTVFVKVNASPIISINEFLETCSNIIRLDASATYDPDGDNLLFTWELPDGKKYLGNSIFENNFSERGIIPILLTVNDMNNVLNSISQKTITIKINNPPIANAGNDTTVCAGDVVLFSGLLSQDVDNDNLQFKWIFDDGSEETGSVVIKKYKHGGLYKAILEVDDGKNSECSKSIDERIIKVNEGPTAIAGSNITACANNPVQFDGSESKDKDGIVNSFEWDFGDGEKGSGAKPIHIYNKAGIYKVVLTVYGDENSDCDNSDKDEITVIINEAPKASFSSKNVVAQNQNLIFDASESYSSTGKIINYKWDFGDGSSSEGKIVEHSFSNYGKYKVNLSIFTDSESSCNISSEEKIVIVNSQPKANILCKSKAAENEIVNFDALSSNDLDGKITKYIWDFGDGSSSEGIQVKHIYKQNGTYRVSLKVIDDSEAENNFDFSETQIEINASPIPLFEIPESIPLNTDLTLDASPSYDIDGFIERYEWIIDEQLVSNEKVFRFKFTQAGYHKIKLIVQDNSAQINNSSSFVLPILVQTY